MTADYIMIDNYGNELNNLDLIATVYENRCVIGVYFKTYIIILDTYDNIRASVAKLRRNNIFTTGRDIRTVDRTDLEKGFRQGKFLLDNVIKISDLTEELVLLRTTILQKLENGMTSSNMLREVKVSAVKEAQQTGKL
jgi:hypothetical protein